MRILVACIGNIFCGDDGFGVEVARRLLQRPPTHGVNVVDFGIRGVDLAYALADGYDAVVIVDALPQGGTPGTLVVLEVEPRHLDAVRPPAIHLDAHSLDPLQVLHWARHTGRTLPRIRIIGCEPARLGTADEPQVGLSEPVQAAIDEALRLVENTIRELQTAEIGECG